MNNITKREYLYVKYDFELIETKFRNIIAREIQKTGFFNRILITSKWLFGTLNHDGRVNYDGKFPPKKTKINNKELNSNICDENFNKA